MRGDGLRDCHITCEEQRISELDIFIDIMRASVMFDIAALERRNLIND